MMARPWNFLVILVLVCSTRASVIQELQEFYDMNVTSPQSAVQKVRRAGPDPADFSWIKRWAAIGDSFTAGIGSGNLFSRQDADYQCSRYDHSYPAIVNNALGPSVQDFQYIACSGDRSIQIYEQVSNMKGNVDLVMMTAGGNDLCLVRRLFLHLKDVHY